MIARPWLRISCRRRNALALLVAAALLTVVFQQGVAGFLIVGAGFLVAGYALASRVLPTPAALDRLLASISFATAAVAVSAEVLSLFRLLGSQAGWIVAAVVCAVACGLVPPRDRPCRSRQSGAFGAIVAALGPRWTTPPRWPERLGWGIAALLVGIVLVHLAATFVLTWFSGIVVYDSISHYLPRSIRYLQYGYFGAYQTYYDFMQYLHQTLVAVQLLYLRSDILVNVTSFVAAMLTCVAVFVLARSLGWPRPYPLFAALVPLSMPLFLLHVSTSNTDIFTALWLVQAVYYLRRGFATTQRGWLLAAMVATALAFASKPTAWFAMPGLGLLWLAVGVRALWRRRLRGALPTFALCAVVFVAVGMPFLLRNQISQGYLVAPPRWQSFMVGGESQQSPLAHRARLLEFNTLALGLQLLTPPFLLPSGVTDGLDPWFTRQAQALGFRLPDPTLSADQNFGGLIRHVTHRYDSNHASYGAAFVLVALPSLLVLPLLRRRLGVRWWYAAGVALYSVCYFLTLNATSVYSVNNTRYLVESLSVLAALSPALFVLLPARIGGTLALAVACVLVAELHDVTLHNKQLPPDLILRVPRDEQYSVFNGNPPVTPRAAAIFDQKYPADEMPDVWIEDTGTPTFPDYAFAGPDLQRRSHYLRTPESTTELPGPYLTRDGPNVERLLRAGGVIVDQIGTEFWLVLPNDRPRVLFWSVRTPDTGAMLLRLQASLPPGYFREPRYSLTLRTAGGEERLRQPQASPVFEVPIEAAGRGTLQVEMRDGEDTRQVERIRIQRQRFMGI